MRRGVRNDAAEFLETLAEPALKKIDRLFRVIADDDTAEIFAVHQGFVEVSPTGPDNITKITILSDVAELGETIDVARAERAKEAATQTLADDPENVEAAAALRRAEVRLEVAGVPRSGGARLDL